MKRINGCKKVFLIVSMMLVMSFLTTESAAAAIKELDVPIYAQEKSKWCWAAAARMAGKYKYPNSTRNQGQIVAYIKGNSGVNEEASIFETVKATEYVTNNTIELSTTLLFNWSWSDIKVSIDNNYPAIALVNKDGSGHYYVIRGYDSVTKEIVVNDPWLGRRYVVSWEEFKNGGWNDETRPYKYTVYFESYTMPEV